jgi:nicotinate-nucleotide adenylyltransferase
MVHKKRIGILGGTFDPIHLGHLVMAEQVREKLRLNQVIFIPSANPPHKTERKLSPAGDRFQMTRLGVDGNSKFLVSDLELKRLGLSYTIDTLKQLKKLYPGQEIYFLTGSDVLDEIQTWREPEQIYVQAKVVIAIRPGFDRFDPENRFAKKSIIVPIIGIDVSSSQIRAKVRKGESIRYLVPIKVEEYINRKKLYRR